MSGRLSIALTAVCRLARSLRGSPVISAPWRVEVCVCVRVRCVVVMALLSGRWVDEALLLFAQVFFSVGLCRLKKDLASGDIEEN